MKSAIIISRKFFYNIIFAAILCRVIDFCHILFTTISRDIFISKYTLTCVCRSFRSYLRQYFLCKHTCIYIRKIFHFSFHSYFSLHLVYKIKSNIWVIMVDILREHYISWHATSSCEFWITRQLSAKTISQLNIIVQK